MQTNPLGELPQTGNPSNERRQVDVAAVTKKAVSSAFVAVQRGRGETHEGIMIVLLSSSSKAWRIRSTTCS